MPPAQGNFVWIPAGDDTTRVAEAFDAAGVLVRPFAGEGMRISVTTAGDSARVIAAARAAQPRPA